MPATTIEVLDSLQSLESLSPEWSELYHRCPRATPFQSPGWLLPWMRHLFQGGQIWTLPVRDHGELVGLAPLFCWGAGQRTVSFLGAGVSDYADVLFAPGRERECVAAVREFLADRGGEWDALDLREVRGGSVLLDGWPAEECSICPVLDLRTYPDATNQRHRTNLRHAHNRLEKHRSACFSFTSDFDAFLRLHESRWGTLGSSLRSFHTAAASALCAKGMLRLCLLEVDDAPVAAAYAFADRTTLYYYLTGYDAAMASLSPGALLLEWLIDQSIAEGLEQVDFLRHTERYKYLWGARDRVSYRINARRDSF